MSAPAVQSPTDTSLHMSACSYRVLRRRRIDAVVRQAVDLLQAKPRTLPTRAILRELEVTDVSSEELGQILARTPGLGKIVGHPATPRKWFHVDHYAYLVRVRGY